MAPLAAAAAFVVVLAVHLHRIVVAAFWNSDIASLPLLAGDMAHRAGGVFNVSVANYWSTFLVDTATRNLPFHRGLWQVFSLAASLLAAVAIVWAARRAAGRPAGILAGAIALCASPIAFYSAYELRGPTWLTGALLLVTLVAVATIEDSPRRRGLAAVMGVAFGVNLASDPLLLLSGMAPLLGAAAGAWLLVRTRPAARVAVTAGMLAAVAVLTDLATGRFMHHLGFRIVPTLPIALAPLSRVPHNVLLLIHNLGAFGNEEFPGAASGLLSIGGAVTLALCLAAVAAAVRFGVPLIRRRSDDPSLGLVLYLLFWLVTAVVVSAGFVFSTLPIGDVTSARYVVPVFLALAGLSGLWATAVGWPRIAAAALGTVFCVMSTLGIAPLTRYLQAYPLAAEGPALIAYLHAKGLTRGYASYWDSLGVTWRTGSGVAVYPVQDCAPTGERALCPFNVNTLTSWYRPQSTSRTFVVVGLPMLPLEIKNPPPPSLGTPVEVDQVGVFAVYIYEGDVAARLR